MDAYSFLSNPTMPGVSSNPPERAKVTLEPEKKEEKTTYGFTIVPDDQPGENAMLVPTAPDLPAEKPKRRRKKVEEGMDIVKAESGEVVANEPTINSYAQTTMMLEGVIQQLDMVASDLKEELDAARMNRTMRNRANTIVGLGEGIGQLLRTKADAIKAINDSITKANDMDYKKTKDLRQMQAGMDNDDKHIMDLYSAFIQNQSNSMANVPQLAMPNPIMAMVPSMNNESVIRSSLAGKNPPPEGEPVDIGYLNYLSRLTPEENMMFYENDPNVQTVVVYDRATEKKFFQVMNIATGQVIPNVPVLDQRFMDDTYLDMKTMTARNSNLNQSYPIVEINAAAADITSQY